MLRKKKHGQQTFCAQQETPDCGYISLRCVLGSFKPRMQRTKDAGQTLVLGNDDGTLIAETLGDELDSERTRWPGLVCPLTCRPPAGRVPLANVVIRRCGPQGSVYRLDTTVCCLASCSRTVALQILPCSR